MQDITQMSNVMSNCTEDQIKQLHVPFHVQIVSILKRQAVDLIFITLFFYFVLLTEA